MSKEHILKNLKHLPFGGAGSVETPERQEQVNQYIANAIGKQYDTTIMAQYLDRYQEWLRSSKLNTLSGLDAFQVAAQSAGTTEGFDKFYLRNRSRRMRCFKGEYMYHAATWKNGFEDWAFIEDEPLDSNDAVVMSMPFSDSGEVHPDADRVIDECGTLGIPVLIDSAFWGLSSGIEFNYDRPAITDITFSLSKSIPVSHLRIGMRLTREDMDDALLVYKSTSYTNRLAAAVGLQVLDDITPDWNYENYAELQHKFCDELGVVPSKSVLFGLDHSGVWEQYNRGRDTSRLCFFRQLANGALGA